jgi:hypothetical protein
MTAAQELINLCELLDIDPRMFDPDPRDEEPEFEHIKFKKLWFLRGYRGYGMQDPTRSLIRIIRDIEDRVTWGDLGHRGQAAYQMMRDKYQRWGRIHDCDCNPIVTSNQGGHSGKTDNR